MRNFLFIPLFLLSVLTFGQTSVDKVFLVDRSTKEGLVKNIDDYQITFEEKGVQGTSTIRLSIIWKILYSNGYEEVFNNPLPENLIAPTNTKEKSKPSFALGGTKNKSTSASPPKEPKTKSYGDSGILEKLSSNQDWRPLVGVDLGGVFPVIFGPEAWTATSEGLALRYGMGGELGISFDPIKYLGISISQGFFSHYSYLPMMEGMDEATTRERITLSNRPTSFKLNIYPKRDIILSAGIQVSSVAISNANPSINGQKLAGYTFGLGKIFHMGKQKNYISFTANYHALTADDFVFTLDSVKFPDVQPLELTFNSLNTIDLKLKFHFGIIN